MKFFTSLALASMAVAAPIAHGTDGLSIVNAIDDANFARAFGDEFNPSLPFDSHFRAIPKDSIPESATDAMLARSPRTPSRTGPDTVNPKPVVETFPTTSGGIKKTANRIIPREIRTTVSNFIKDTSNTVKQKLELLPRFQATDTSGLGKVEKISRDLSFDDAEYSQAVKDFLKTRQDGDDGLDSFA